MILALAAPVIFIGLAAAWLVTALLLALFVGRVVAERDRHERPTISDAAVPGPATGSTPASELPPPDPVSAAPGRGGTFTQCRAWSAGKTHGCVRPMGHYEDHLCSCFAEWAEWGPRIAIVNAPKNSRCGHRDGAS